MKIVIKVGTSTLAHATGKLNIRKTAELCRVISDLKNAGNEVVLVSSGAIGMGVVSRAGECRFFNCTHTHEPHCAVVEAVKRGEIAFSRYESYLKILDEDDKYRK